MHLSAQQIETLSGDPATLARAKKLAAPLHWRAPGRSERALWAEHKGSDLYQVRVDLGDLASVFGAVLASMRALCTQMVVFDTSVVDLTQTLSDPVDLLFGTQLGGGTDIAKALAYCQQIITRPEQTILVLSTDLYEGGDARLMRERAAALVAAGVHVICLLALADQGAPAYDHDNARRFAELGIPTFACTPDLFPELMAAAIQRRDLGLWAAQSGLVAARADDEPA